MVVDNLNNFGLICTVYALVDFVMICQNQLFAWFFNEAATGHNAFKLIAGKYREAAPVGPHQRFFWCCHSRHRTAPEGNPGS